MQNMELVNKKSTEELKKEIKKEKFKRITLSFYKYVSVKNPVVMRDYLFEKFEKLGCKGRIYIAEEGINAQMNVPEHNFDSLDRLIQSISEFKGIPYKKAIEESVKSSFLKLIVRVRNQIVTDGINEENFDPSNTGKYFNAEEVNEHIKKGGMIIDMRNLYEARVGRFKDARVMNVQTFKQQLENIERDFNNDKNKEILLYCTGGIRCEKASAWMKFKGFKNVAHIKGGIIDYTHQVREKGIENNFVGKNFVFDERLGERITDDVIGVCDVCCKTVSDDFYNCRKNTCSKLFISCDGCLQKRKGFCSAGCQFLNIFAKHKR